MKAERFWPYVGRFSLFHLISYVLISVPFLVLQNTLPDSERVALEFFATYRSLSLLIIAGELLRGAVLGLVLFPLYKLIVKGNLGRWILFGLLWGVAILGSLQPMPGSIEGIIYTETSLVEHFMVLVAGALQVILFSTLFLHWERKSNLGGVCRG